MTASAATHADLVQLGARWLRRQGFPVVASELRCIGTREEPDVIGFRTHASVVIEVKCSRADYLADRRKPHRGQDRGMGLYRFFLCPQGLILPEELPAGWGLLYAANKRVTDVVRPTGNIWPSARHTCGGDWNRFQHVFDADAERAALFSIARRAMATTAS